jgi:hypothetical protein
MKTKLFPILTFFLVTVVLFAQDNGNTIENQFIDVVDNSNNYQEFKVIKKTKIYTLRKNILDSIAALESLLESSNAIIDQQKNELAILSQNLTTTQENLITSKEKEDGIEVFGILTKKSTYINLMWVIILGLLALLSLVLYKFKKNHTVTKEAQLKFSEIENEFDAYRQKTLEENQLIGRKLQDEIIKNRKPK